MTHNETRVSNERLADLLTAETMLVVTVEEFRSILTEIQALEAELARKTEALPDLSSVISWLENGCDPKNGAKEIRIYAARIAAALEEKTDV